jgi:hypothetical protein
MSQKYTKEDSSSESEHIDVFTEIEEIDDEVETILEQDSNLEINDEILSFYDSDTDNHNQKIMLRICAKDEAGSTDDLFRNEFME